MNFLSNKYLLRIARFILGIVFIVTSIDKIDNPDAFAANIVAYKLAPYALINVIALMMPWLELLCGVFLIAGVYVRGSSVLISVLLGVFMVAMMSALLRGLDIDCGCFGKEHASPVTWMKVFEDVGLLVLGLYSYRFSWLSEEVKARKPQQTSSA